MQGKFVFLSIHLPWKVNNSLHRLLKTAAVDFHPFHAVKWLYYIDSIIWWYSQKLTNQKICYKVVHVNLQVRIMGMKLFCERIRVTCTLQVPARVVELNPQTTWRSVPVRVRVEYAYTYPYKFECSTSLLFVLCVFYFVCSYLIDGFWLPLFLTLKFSSTFVERYKTEWTITVLKCYLAILRVHRTIKYIVKIELFFKHIYKVYKSVFCFELFS